MQPLQPVEFVRILNRTNRTFEAYGRDVSGTIVHVCAKPQLRSRSDETGERLLGEWMGYKIAEKLQVPVPQLLLMELTPEFIQSTGGQLNDVLPGLALATVWQEQKFEYPFFPPRQAIRNPDTVAGVTVLDTIQQNNDRREDNVLSIPDMTSAGEKKFFLVYIDNGWLVWGRLKDKVSRIRGMVPQSNSMCLLVSSQLDFMTYFLWAESLDETSLSLHLTTAPVHQWSNSGFQQDLLPDEAVWRGTHTREIVMGCMHRFPNLYLSSEAGSHAE